MANDGRHGKISLVLGFGMRLVFVPQRGDEQCREVTRTSHVAAYRARI